MISALTIANPETLVAKLPEKSQQVIHSHAMLIVQVVKASQNPQMLVELESMLEHAAANGWTNLVQAIRKILKGERELSLLNGLDEEDSIIIEAILRGLRDPNTLPDPSTRAGAEHAAPALAQMIHAATSGDVNALQMVAAMAEQMTRTHGDMARLGGALSRMVNGEIEPEILCKNMDTKGEKLILDILTELGRLRAH